MEHRIKPLTPRPLVVLAFASIAAAASSAALAGCYDCNNSPVPHLAISVTVTDAQTNAAVTDAMVSYSLMGGAVQQSQHAGSGRYAVQRDADGRRTPAGSYFFTVSKPGYRTEMRMGSMAAGACGDGDQITVTLTPGS